MKVKELIEALSELNQEAMVVVSGHEGGVDDLFGISEVVVRLNVNPESYYGDHEVEYGFDTLCKPCDIPDTHAIAVHLY